MELNELKELGIFVTKDECARFREHNQSRLAEGSTTFAEIKENLKHTKQWCERIEAKIDNLDTKKENNKENNKVIYAMFAILIVQLLYDLLV